jgi:hypothetical protein
MPFTIPDLPLSPTIEQVSQSQIDAVDLDVLVGGLGRSAVIAGGSACVVTSNGNQTVAVASGTIRIAGVQVSVTGQNVIIAANGSGNPRFDLITVGLSGTPVATQGSPIASPVFPAIPANSIALAAVWVTSPLQSSVASADIVDKRILIPDSLGVATPTNTYAALASDRFILADGTTTAFTVTLSAASPSQMVTVTKKDAAAHTITVSGQVSGAVTLTTQYATKSFISDGTNWYAV